MATELVSIVKRGRQTNLRYEISFYDWFFIVEEKIWKERSGEPCKYYGEVDQDDNVCGYGTYYMIDR